MKAGIWQILIWTGLILFFFWPVVVKVVRALSGTRGGDAARGRIRRRPSGAFACPKCGEELAPECRFCSRCGAPVDAIDV